MSSNDPIFSSYFTRPHFWCRVTVRWRRPSDLTDAHPSEKRWQLRDRCPDQLYCQKTERVVLVCQFEVFVQIELSNIVVATICYGSCGKKSSICTNVRSDKFDFVVTHWSAVLLYPLITQILLISCQREMSFRFIWTQTVRNILTILLNL